MADYIFKRNELFYYLRRVPSEVSAYDPRKFVKISLKTTDLRTAERKAHIFNDHLEEFWRSLITSGLPFDSASYKKTLAIAKAHGFAYKTAAAVAQAPLTEIIERIALTREAAPEVVTSLLGGLEVPSIMLSDCLQKYWPQCVDRLTNKSEQQIRRWKVPRTDAFNNFIRVIGDKPIAEISRHDALKFRDWWGARIANEKLSTDTANKQMRTVADVLSVVGLACALEKDFAEIFKRLQFKRQSASRPPFSAKFVQEVLLNPDNLRTMNDDCRYLIYAAADTGARPSELIGLTEADIFLNEPIPHIWIRPAKNRMLKTPHSERQIPLVGAALHAFQKMPKGFTRYSTADSASAAINKYLRTHTLLESDNHSLYSLRHTFKDRLRDVGAPEEVIDSLMGHENLRPKYGRGHILETKQIWVKKIIFPI